MWRWVWVAVLGGLVVGCAEPTGAGARSASESATAKGEPSAPSVANGVQYATGLTPGGVVGAAAQGLVAEVSAALVQRGDVAEADGLLGATATWMLRELLEGRSVDQAAGDAAARRVGFAGVVLSMAGFDRAQNGQLWRDALGRVPANLPVNRYGISASRDGRSVAVVFGAVELTLQPFPRQIALNGALMLRGVVGPRFAFSHVYLNKPDGTVEERRMRTREVQTAFSFSKPGRYKLEVMGDGATGPVILANVPLYVGVPDSEAPTTVGGAVASPVEAEARLLVLLNRSRSAAGFNVLEADDDLRTVALGHSTDMAEHDFFGHISPTTGDAESRIRRSGIAVSAYGENIAQSDTAEGAHESLMSSPGHRANMLGAQYTHIGIATARARGQLVFTLLFARRATLANVPRNAAQFEAAFLALRAKNGLKMPTADAVLRNAAQAGLQAFRDAAAPTTDVAIAAMKQAITREVQRSHIARGGGCSFIGDLVDLSQLEQNPLLRGPLITRYGLAALPRNDAKGPRLTVLMFLEGATCP